MSRVCTDCAGPISRCSKGRCRVCAARHLNASPEIAANREAARNAYFARPGVREGYAARIAVALANESPAARQRRRDHGRRVAATNLHTPAMKQRLRDPAMKAANGRKRTDTVLAWCPPEYRDRYRYLKDTKLYRAAEARRLIEDEIAADRARATAGERAAFAALSPHERAMARVAAGAQLVAKPDLRRPDPAFTIGGVAPEAM